MAKRKNDTEDLEAFRHAVRDVKPLRHEARVTAPATKKRRRRAPEPAELASDLPLIPEATHAPLSGDSVQSFQRAGVRIQVMRKLRRGLYPAQDELDLHGLTQTAARERLAQFIDLSRGVGHRCVRIIHGKGYRSGARGPILKVAVDLWLRRHMDVMAFASAKAIDGGTGALYVLLRA
jgi:DNA-nicking Smr family endonuclease